MNSINPNRGHYSPPPTVTHLTAGPEPLSTEATERDLLRAVVEALDLPIPDTSGDDRDRHELLLVRALSVVSALNTALAGDSLDAKTMTAWLREQTAKTPETYKVWGGES